MAQWAGKPGDTLVLTDEYSVASALRGLTDLSPDEQGEFQLVSGGGKE